MITTDRRVEVFSQRGWCPVPWAHHPPEVKRELHRIGMRPQLKACYMNCQNFALQTDLDVEYREGWVVRIIPMQHAWLMYGGKVLDLTLHVGDGHPTVEYLQSEAYTTEQIFTSLHAQQSWNLINEQRSYELSPFYEQVEAMNRKAVRDGLSG